MLMQRYVIRAVCFVVVSLVSFGLTIFIVTVPTRAQTIVLQAASSQLSSSQPSALADYPADLPRNIPWSAKFDGWSDVVAAFANARVQENTLLGTVLPPIAFPAAAEWEDMSRAQRAFWLINEERSARGLPPLQGLEKNVSEVAQAYAEWLLANNLVAHDGDGHSPWDRLAENAAIGACHDFLPIAENLYFQATTSPAEMPLVIERAVYTMLYDDASSQWGHRHTLLWTPYTENSGDPDREGFVGMGYAHGTFTDTADNISYQNADMIVMNFFDPCATWSETAPLTLTPTPLPTPEPITDLVPPQTRTVSGRIATPIVMAPMQSAVASNAVNQGSDDRVSEGIVDVTITSEDGHITLSDPNGHFILAGLSPQAHTLAASKEGYSFSPPSVEVDLSAGDLDGVTIVGVADSTATPIAISPSFSLHLPLISPAQSN